MLLHYLRRCRETCRRYQAGRLPAAHQGTGEKRAAASIQPPISPITHLLTCLETKCGQFQIEMTGKYLFYRSSCGILGYVCVRVLAVPLSRPPPPWCAQLPRNWVSPQQRRTMAAASVGASNCFHLLVKRKI